VRQHVIRAWKGAQALRQNVILSRPMVRIACKSLVVVALWWTWAAPLRCGEAPAGRVGLVAPEKPPPVTASSALLIDYQTGKVLFAKAARQRRPMASTTKIMTALLVVEHGKLGTPVTISANALKTKSGSLWVEAGQQMPMGDLLKAILLNSCNDACVAAAEAMCGSESKLVGLMNKRASELGLRDTHFANSNGLHAPDQYSTAYDLAQLTRHALRYRLLRRLVATTKLTIPWPGKPWGRVLQNHNKLLWMLPGADGVKTGFVKESGKCLVASATRKGWRLLAVVLNSEEVWQDASRLLEYGFARFRMVRIASEAQAAGRAPVAGGRVNSVNLIAAQPISAVVRRENASLCQYQSDVRLPLRAPLDKGERVGQGWLVLRGAELVRGDLLVARRVPLSWPLTIWWLIKRLLQAAAVLVLLAFGVRTCAKAIRRRSARRLAGGRTG